MGNRAVISFKGVSTGVYLHWNGGTESIKAFLDCAKELGIRSPVRDSYGIARFSQLVGNFFGGNLSLGVGPVDSLDCDNGDNGLYIVGEDWDIIGRKYRPIHSYNNFKQEFYEGVFNECMEINKPIFERKNN